MLIVTDGYTTNKRDTQTEESEQWNTKIVTKTEYRQEHLPFDTCRTKSLFITSLLIK